jgi:chromosome segregation ATPase
VQALKDQITELQANLQSVTDKSAAELAEMTAQRDRNREIGLKHQRAVGPLRQQVAELTKERDQLKQEKEEAANALQDVNRALAELQEAARTTSTSISTESSDQRVQELTTEKARLEAALAAEVSARQAAEKQVEVEHADAVRNFSHKCLVSLFIVIK